MTDLSARDDVLEAVLRSRAGYEAPPDLHARILALVAADDSRRPRVLTVPGDLWRLLAVAALALATVGTVLVGGSAAVKPALPAVVRIGGLWVTDSKPALEIQRAPGDQRSLYWRATTYDTFTLGGWTGSAPATMDRQANAPLLADTLDAIPKTSARAEATFVVTPASDIYRVAFSPIDPVSIDRGVTLNLSGGFVQSISVSDSGPYTITAAIPVDGDVPGGVTQSRLRAAGTNYPPPVLARYTEVPNGAMGRAANDLLEHVLAQVNASTNNKPTPFDIATAIVTELQSPTYRYNTNMLGICDPNQSVVECFAQHKEGYCEHYASTMAILLRAVNIPSRLVDGFLPGSLDPTTGIERIKTDAAHAWVEVYFPGYGWQMFDPTGGGIAKTQPGSPPERSFVPLPTAAPQASLVVPTAAAS